jgi:Uma2 family endonuclease
VRLARIVDLIGADPMGYTGTMHAVIIDPPEDVVAERRRLGIDGRDEVWDGVLHMVPPPTSFHSLLQVNLIVTLVPIARRIGLEIYTESGLFDPGAGEKNFRVPDLMVVDPARVSRRGTEGRAEIAIEILSPGDESRKKLPFYAKHGTQEVWLVHPETRVVEVYVLRGQTYVAVAPEADGSVRAPRLGLVLRTVAGPKLRLEWADGLADI